MSANIRWGATGYPASMEFKIDSAGHSISFLPGDTVWYLSNGIRHGLRRYDSICSDLLWEVVDSGAYEFHFLRRVATDTFSATFTLPVIPFHISAPAPESHVSRFNHTNDTIVYTPAGGTELWVFYYNYNKTETMGVQYSEPDNGKYGLVRDGYSDGYIQLLRHFVGSLSSPGAFKSVHYDYWESSKPLKLHF